MIIFFYKELTRKTKFGTGAFNKMLLNAAKCQGHSFYRFFVIKGKPTRGVQLHPAIQIMVKEIWFYPLILFHLFICSVLTFLFFVANRLTFSLFKGLPFCVLLRVISIWRRNHFAIASNNIFPTLPILKNLSLVNPW